MSVSLADLLPPNRMVKLGNGELAITGINLEQLVVLWEKYAPVLAPFFSTSVPDFVGIAAKSPSFVAEVVCMASGTSGQEDVALKLPAAIQVELLLAIWEETVPNLAPLMTSLTALSRQVISLKPKPGTPVSSEPLPGLPKLLSQKDIL